MLDRVGEQAFELAYIKSSGAYAWGQKLRRNALVQAARRLKGAPTGLVEVRATGRSGAMGGKEKGSEVWLLSVVGAPGEPGIPWDFVDATGFSQRESVSGAYGVCLYAGGPGTARAQASGGEVELRFMSHPWSGVVEVTLDGRTETIDLSSESTRTVVVRPGRAPLVSVEHEAGSVGLPDVHVPSGPVTEFTAIDERFLERVRSTRPAAVAVHCPRWLGITSATEKLFDCCYRVPQTPDKEPHRVPEAEIARHARVLVESGVKHIVISGGDPSHQALVAMLRAMAPDLTIDVLWHGSYLQLQDSYEWNTLRGWIEAARAGQIRSICTVKAGMEDFFRSQGIRSHLVLNYVPGEPLEPPVLDDSPVHVGVWISGVSFRKSPLVMISAMAMMGDCRLHAAGLDPRGSELAAFLGVGIERMSERPLPQRELLEAMRSTHVSLYTTFSECCPMLPLESLHQGVPCLTGPSSHLFEDDAWLFSRLVVPFPDRAEVIAKYMRRAVDERHEIMERYRAYVVGYNARAQESVRQLVEEGPSLERRQAGMQASRQAGGSQAEESEAVRQRGSEAGFGASGAVDSL